MKSIDEINRDRLNLLIQEVGSQVALSRIIDRSPAQISQWKNASKYSGSDKRRAMDRHTARYIEKMTRKPVGWMDRPIESDFEPPTSAASLLVAEPARQLDPFMPNVIKVPMGTRKVPLVSYVQAGNWTEVVDTYSLGSASDWLLTDLDLSDTAFALEIKGDSMLPDFREGDRIIIDPSVQPTPGDFVVAKNSETEATFKKYRPRGTNEQGVQVIELTPLNPDFPSLRSDISPVTIIGTMVEHRRYRKK